MSKEDKHKEDKPKHEKIRDKELHELNQIKYKSMILPNNRNIHNNLSPRESNNSNLTSINDFLEKEKQQHVGEQWCKLDKTSKMQKIRIFIDKYVAENGLTAKDSKALLEFLTTSLNQKKLSKTKDVVYDKSTGLIKSIPCLLFNIGQRKFTLKRVEKRQTTMRVVGAKRVTANKTRDHKSSKPNSRSNSATHSRNTSNHNSDDEGVTLVVTNK
jgi:hypothetical protein